MNCVGGSNDGRTFPVRPGLRHGSVVNVPRLRSVLEPRNFDPDEPIGLVSLDEVIEEYRCFKFRLDGAEGVCLVTNAWTDEQAWEEIKARFNKTALAG